MGIELRHESEKSWPPIPLPNSFCTQSVLADSGVSSPSGSYAEFSESRDGRKIQEKTFSSENSSEFCTHRPTRARLPPFADASLTAPDLLTRDDVEHSNVGGSGGRRRGPRRSSSHPALSLLLGMFTFVLAPLSTHPPLSKKGFQHSKIFASL